MPRASLEVLNLQNADAVALSVAIPLDGSSTREIATFGSKNSTNGTVSILPHEGALAP